jgi:hypothetical protein
MAYATKYYAKYKYESIVRTIRLQLEDYSGGLIELFCSTEGPVEEQGEKEALFGETIVTKLVRFEFMFKTHPDLGEFVVESRTFKVLITEYSEFLGEDVVKFEGFIEPYDIFREYRKPYYFVSMTATCGLNRLSKNIFPQTEFNAGNLELDYFTIVQRCLATIGIERPLQIGLHTQQFASPIAPSPNPLLSCRVSVFRYFVDGTWMDCQTVIADILVKFNAQLFLREGKWVIWSFVDQIHDFYDYLEYPVGGGGPSAGNWLTVTDEVNGPEPVALDWNHGSVEGGQVAINPRIRKYAVNVDLGGKKEQFSNGGMQLWDVDGPVGWEGNVIQASGGMPGWTKVETGIEGSPYALNIRGYAPHPYFKKKKKGIWPFRKTVTYPIPPETYFKTPTIEILNTDESITVGFEYFTEANSAGFLYTISLYASNPVPKSDLNRIYIKPEAPGFPYDNDYTLLIAPAHPKIDPVTGISQSKGKIQYNLDLKQLNGPNPGTDPKRVFYDRVEIFFYLSNKENGKTGDEYTIYRILGEKTASPESEVPEGDSQYKVTLESNPYESDEGESIPLISGDYSAGFLGTTYMIMDSGTKVLTGRWSRRGRPEQISIYRAMLADRVSLTYKNQDVIRADIKRIGGMALTYQSLLIFKDRDLTKVYKIATLKFNHYTQIATVVAVEATYTELSEIKQRSYTTAQGLLDEDSEGDGIYPGAGTPSGRIGLDEDEIFEPEPTEEDIANARQGVFEDVPALVYTVNERSTSAVHLREYLSEAYLDEEEDEDIEEEDRHDPEDFVLSVVTMPSWVESVEIDGLSVYVTAKPTAIGSYQLVLSVVDDAFGQVPNVVVPITVYPPIKVKYTLRDTSGVEPVAIGEVFNGAGFIKPETSFDIIAEITGHHEGWYGRLTTPDDVIVETPDPYELVSSRESGTYELGDEVPAEIGFYQIDLGVFRDEGEPDNLKKCKGERLKFSFYDEETLAKAKFFLWGAESNTLIGAIKPDGSSSFVVKEPWDVRMEITGVSHDRGVSTLGSEVGELDEAIFIQPAPVDDAVYYQFGEVRTEFDPSVYNIFLELTKVGIHQYVRAISFQINHKTVQPTAGALQLGTVPANTTDFDLIEVLAPTGGSYPLPDEGWTVLNESESAPFDAEEWFLYWLVAGNLVNIDIAAYTGNPQVISYGATPITQVVSRLFGLLSSKQIGSPSIHKMPSSFRVINRRRLAGEIVATYQSDFSFGPPVDLGDVEIGGPATGTGGVILESGLGIEIIKDGPINTINVSYNPDEFFVDPLDRILNLKDNGVTLAKLDELPSLSVIGNMTGGPATPSAVGVITSTTLAGATNSVLATALAVKTYVDNAFTSVISGTAGRIAKFLTATTLAASLLSESGINIIANAGQFVTATAPNVNPRGLGLYTDAVVARWTIGKSGLESGADSGSDFTFARYSDAGSFLGYVVTITRATGLMSLIGTLTVQGSGVVINTASTTLNPNFNSDLLDNEHGAFYLARANHTGFQLAATISDFSAAVRLVTLTGLSIVTGSPITAADTILSAFGKLQGQINTVTGAIGTGTVGYIPLYTTTTTFANSILNQSGINIQANGGQFLAATAHNVNPRGLVLATDALTSRWVLGKSGLESGANSGSDYTLARYNDAGGFLGFSVTVNRATGLMSLPGTLTIGGSGVVINTTSTALNPNFNSDLLDNEHGAFYLARANHTGFQAISTITGLQTALDGKVNNFGNGVANRFAIWFDNTTIANSNLYYNVGNVGVGMVPGYQFDVAGSIRYSNQLASTVASGTAPLDVTSTTLCVNLNADMLDGQHGAYYRDRANHTGFQAISTVTGLQTALDSKLSGAGTAGKIMKYVNSVTAGDSIMAESGADIIVSGQLFSDVAHNTNVRGFGYRALGLNRWNVGKAGTEAGGNSGSDYVGWAYNDAGGFLREAFRFSRATGDLTLPAAVFVSGGNSNNWNTAFSWGNHAGLYALASHTHTIAQVTGLQASLDSKVINFGNGVANRFALWVDNTQIGNSNLYYNAGNIGVGMSPGYQFDVSGSIRYSNQLASTVGSGTMPIDVTSTTMCTNLNADMVDGLHASAFALASHTHVAANITDFTSAARASFSAGTSISIVGGVISYTGSAGLTGSGTNTYFSVWTGGSSLGVSVIRDTGSEINVGSGRSFGVEGPAAMRDYLHVWGYQANGTASNHGTLILHNLASASISSCAAIEILSTTRGFVNARMTRAQRLAMTPTNGLQVYQTDTVAASISGLKLYDGGQWYHIMGDTLYA